MDRNQKDGPKKYILVVDDDEHLLQTLVDFLDYKGFETGGARSGEEALVKLSERKPDLVILDISMPGMGGVGFLRRITNSEGRRQCPVLVLTARSLMKDFFDTLEVDGFVPKPCDEAGLEAEIWRILRKTESQARIEADRARARRVLIGDDDSHAAQRLEGALRAAGYEVEVANTGPVVLEKAPVFKPDVVAMRDILSGLNGQKVISLLAIMPSTRTVPSVLYGWTPDPNKPFSPQPLGELVRCLSSAEVPDIVRAVQAAVASPPA